MKTSIKKIMPVYILHLLKIILYLTNTLVQKITNHLLTS